MWNSLRIAIVAIVFVSSTALIGASPVALASTTDLLVGDSVMAGMSRSARADLPNHVFDARVCRRLTARSCVYQGVRPATALDVIRSWRGATDRAIVVGAGYNDSSIGSAVDAIVAEARAQGVPHVLWLTYRIAGSNATTYRSHNSVLWQKAQQHPELRIVDWAGHSAGRADWVATDGLHLNASGARALAGLIDGELDALPPPGPPRIAAGEQRCFSVAGEPGDAALVNLTPVVAGRSGHGVLTRSGIADVDAVSNVNFAPGTVDPNVAMAPIGPDGEVCYLNSPFAPVHLVADHLATIHAESYEPARTDGLPQRVVDTRIEGSPLAPGDRRCFDVAGDPGDVAVVNLTPVEAGAGLGGHGALVSSDLDMPADISNVNFAAGTVDPNVAMAPIGDDGTVCFDNAPLVSVHLVADHLGTIDADVVTPASPSGLARRVVDTRPSGEPVDRGARRCFAVSGDPGDLAVVNLTPVEADGGGHGVLLNGEATGAVVASNVNFAPGTIDPNVAFAPIGTDGTVCFRNADLATVHLVADHLVTIDEAAVTLASGTGFPVRIVDTRV